jgi:hypothetical protein
MFFPEENRIQFRNEYLLILSVRNRHDRLSGIGCRQNIELEHLWAMIFLDAGETNR